MPMKFKNLRKNTRNKNKLKNFQNKKFKKII